LLARVRRNTLPLGQSRKTRPLNNRLARRNSGGRPCQMSKWLSLSFSRGTRSSNRVRSFKRPCVCAAKKRTRDHLRVTNRCLRFFQRLPINQVRRLAPTPGNAFSSSILSGNVPRVSCVAPHGTAEYFRRRAVKPRRFNCASNWPTARTHNLSRCDCLNTPLVARLTRLSVHWLKRSSHEQLARVLAIQSYAHRVNLGPNLQSPSQLFHTRRSQSVLSPL